MVFGENPLNSLKFTGFPHLGAQMGLGGAPARQTMKTAVITTISGGYLGCQNGKRVENTTEIGFKCFFVKITRFPLKLNFCGF